MKRTIERMDLLKSLPTEAEQDKAAVYTEGLAQMRASGLRPRRSKDSDE